MKHAFLITAYDYPQQLYDLVEALNHADVFFYIHLDKKNKEIIHDPAIRKIQTFPNVEILSNRIKVNWGAFSHTRAILSLMERAIQNNEIEYFHTLSGQDFPVRPPSEFFHFFEKAKKEQKEFMINKKVPTPDWKGNQGLDRIWYYHFNDILNPKIWWQQKLIRAMVILQKMAPFKRPLPKEFTQLYGGHVWWSLSRNSISYILDFLESHPAFLKRFRYTHCSEEIIFQTIIMNAPFSQKVDNNNQRYYKMQGASPKVFDQDDYEDIINSGRFFVRKISLKSAHLVELLKQNRNRKGNDDNS